MKYILYISAIVFLIISCHKVENKTNKQLTKKSLDSVNIEFEENEKILSKVTIDSLSRKIGTRIDYKNDSILRVVEYENSKVEGSYVKFNEYEYPEYMTIIRDDKLNFYIQFYENGMIKNLTSDNKKGKIGITIDYYDNGKMMSKSELLNGKTHGVMSEYDRQGNLIKKTEYKNGIIQK